MAWWNKKGADQEPAPKPMDEETRLIQKPKTSMDEFKADWVANMQKRIQGGGGGSSGEGFKKGGRVKKTGPAKVHKGEYVIKKAAADKIGPKKLSSLNQASRDKKLLQNTRFR